jgi:hypothetical protein
MARMWAWAVALIAVAALAVSFRSSSASSAAEEALTNGQAAAHDVVRARAFVLEDDHGAERGRLAVGDGCLILRCSGEGEKGGVEIEMYPGGTPHVTVSTPGKGPAVTMSVGEEAWISALGAEGKPNPGVSMGLKGTSPVIALRDENRTRAVVWVLMGSPQVGLYDDSGELYWHTPVLPAAEGVRSKFDKPDAEAVQQAQDDEERARRAAIQEAIRTRNIEPGQ